LSSFTTNSDSIRGEIELMFVYGWESIKIASAPNRIGKQQYKNLVRGWTTNIMLAGLKHRSAAGETSTTKITYENH
jgi:hypothetical protein